MTEGKLTEIESYLSAGEVGCECYIPELIAEVRRLKAEVERLEDQIAQAEICQGR